MNCKLAQEIAWDDEDGQQKDKFWIPVMGYDEEKEADMCTGEIQLSI